LLAIFISGMDFSNSVDRSRAPAASTSDLRLRVATGPAHASRLSSSPADPTIKGHISAKSELEKGEHSQTARHANEHELRVTDMW
jgi:hypothetical protein